MKDTATAVKDQARVAYDEQSRKRLRDKTREHAVQHQGLLVCDAGVIS